MSHSVAAEISGPLYVRADSFTVDMDVEVYVEPALCAVEAVVEEDHRYVKSVRFDMDDCTDKQSSRPGKHGKEFIPGPSYSRKCVAARVAARQRAIDLASVVDEYNGSFGRRWRVVAGVLYDDRRV